MPEQAPWTAGQVSPPAASPTAGQAPAVNRGAFSQAVGSRILVHHQSGQVRSLGGWTVVIVSYEVKSRQAAVKKETGNRRI